jgi:hypothetical protein
MIFANYAYKIIKDNPAVTIESIRLIRDLKYVRYRYCKAVKNLLKHLV